MGRALRVLDMGCGTGVVAAPLASLGHNVEAVDVDPDSIAFANAKYSLPNLKFSCLDALSDELPRSVSSPFDVVLAGDLIEHVEDPERLVHNALKCGSETGMYLFTTVNGYNLWEVFVWLLKKIEVDDILRRLKRRFIDSRKSAEELAASGSMNLGSGAPHVQHFTPGRLTKLFLGHGLYIEESRNAGTLLALGSFGPLRSRTLQRFDLSLGPKFPSCLAGGWYFCLRRGTCNR